MSTDEELMAAYVAGDQAAFRELFERYGPALLSLYRRSGLKEHDGQDLVQQTFLQLHRARFDFRPGNRLRPWLYTIALNLKRELYRSRGRRPQAALEVDPAGADPPPSDGLERGEDVVALRDALAQLPENQKEVIELHWFQGLPFPEIARIAGASLSAVKVRAHRGYECLRELLGRRTGSGQRA